MMPLTMLPSKGVIAYTLHVSYLICDFTSEHCQQMTSYLGRIGTYVQLQVNGWMKVKKLCVYKERTRISITTLHYSGSPNENIGANRLLCSQIVLCPFKDTLIYPNTD